VEELRRLKSMELTVLSCCKVQLVCLVLPACCVVDCHEPTRDA
jgi:hypothetical protein